GVSERFEKIPETRRTRRRHRFQPRLARRTREAGLHGRRPGRLDDRRRVQARRTTRFSRQQLLCRLPMKCSKRSYGNRTLKVWDAEAGKCVATFYAEGPIYCCDFSGDNVMIVAGGMRGVYFLRPVR